MEIEIKDPQKGKQDINVIIPQEEFNKYINKVIKKLSENIKIDGFRKGKAPANLIKNRIGEDKILEQAGEEAFNKTYVEAIQKTGHKKIADIQRTVNKISFNDGFEYKLTITLWPKVELGDFSTIKLDKKNIKITEREINKVLNDYRKIHATEILVIRPAQKGDKVEIDATIYLHNVPIEGGILKKYPFIIGEGVMIPGFEEQIIGMKAGEEKTFEIAFPKNYFDKKIAGKKCKFAVKLLNVYNRNLPELNDDFAKLAGGVDTLDEFKNYIKEQLLKDKNKKEEDRLQKSLIEEMIKKSKFDKIPEILIDKEIEKMIEEFKRNVEKMGIKFDDYLRQIKKTIPEIKLDFAAEANIRVKAGILILALIEKENIQATEQELKEYAKKIIPNHSNKEIHNILKIPEYSEYIRDQFLIQKLMDLLTKKYIKNNN